jgi:hypothetical protein
MVSGAPDKKEILRAETGVKEHILSCSKKVLLGKLFTFHQQIKKIRSSNVEARNKFKNQNFKNIKKNLLHYGITQNEPHTYGK